MYLRTRTGFAPAPALPRRGCASELPTCGPGRYAAPATRRSKKDPVMPEYRFYPLDAGLRDATGQALVYLYGRETEADARQAKVRTNDEARQIAVNGARLPELFGKVGD
jgi:hypothetical protein